LNDFRITLPSLDPLHDVSLNGRHYFRDGKGRALKLHCGAYPGRLAVWNSGTRRTAIGVRHHPGRLAFRVVSARPVHDLGGVGGEFAKSSGAFFFVWSLIALGVTSLFSVILSVRGLWSLQQPGR